MIGVDAVDALMDVKMAIRDRFLPVPCEFPVIEKQMS